MSHSYVSSHPRARRLGEGVPVSTFPPSRIARTIAGQLWADVHSQHKLADGIFAFSCAGHGGVVAVIGVADLPDAAVQAARGQGLVELAVVVTRGRNTRIFTSHKYERASLIELASTNPDATLYELWIGEEDCGWATIIHSAPHALAGGIKAGYFADHVTIDDVNSSLTRWHPAFIAALENRTHYVHERFCWDQPRDESGRVRIRYDVRKLGSGEIVNSLPTREAALADANARERVAA